MADEFLTTYTPLANDIATRTGVDPTVVLGIIDTETGGGKRVTGNNIFGISPVRNGQQYVEKYPDVETASEAFVTLMQTPRYRAVAAAGSPAAQAAALVKSGYNTVNPSYARTVADKATRFGQILGYQDEGQGGPAPAAATRPAPAPDYNSTLASPAPAPATPPAAPATPAAPAGNATDQLLRELKQPPATTAPVAAPGPAQPSPPVSATDQLLEELRTPPPAGTTMTGPPVAPRAPREYTTDNAMGDQGGTGGTAEPAPPPLEPSDRSVRVTDAMVKGWKDSPSFWVNPQGESTRSKVENLDPYGVGRFILAPAGDILSGALGVGNALLKGGQEIVYQQIAPISPSLARDVAAVPEAFPFGPPGTVRPPRTMQEARNALNQPILLKDITGAIKRADEVNALDPSLPGPPAPEPAPAPAPAAAPPRPEAAPVEAPARAATEQPQPASAGAAATTEPLPDTTKGQRITYLDKDRDQTAWNRANGMRDDNVYFEGIPERPEALKNYDPQYALDHKTYYGDGSNTEYRANFDAVNKERHNGMTDAIKKDMGDGISLEEKTKERREVSPDALGVFDEEKSVDPGLLDGFRKKVERHLSALEKRGGPRRILKEVYDTLFDADGNIETMPSKLQGVRDNMTDHLEKGSGTDTAAKDVQAVRNVLTDLVEDLNPVMQSGAPKWDTFRQEWAARSRLIDQQKFLQQYRAGASKSLWDAEGKLVFGKVNQLLADIAAAHRKPRHEAQALTDEQIQTIVKVRNELAAEDLVDRQAKIKGSPTPQLLNSMARKGMGPVGKTFQKAADAAAHGIAAYSDAPLLNAALAGWQLTRPMREAAKVAKQDAKINALNEARKAELLSQDRNPLAPP